MAKKTIAAAEAVKSFKGASIEVQVATPAKKKGEDGKVRRVFDVAMKPLAAEHVLNACAYDDGRVAITTIDGKRHEARA